jgi:tRNA threonylcarbamoyladenosine biosynthesis protein TsaE
VTAPSRNPHQRGAPPVTLQSQSEHQTREVGRHLGRLVQAGDVLCLEGELGTGKTVLAQGLAESLGVAEPVTSPSFTLIHEHQGRLPFYHVDLYRLSPSEISGLGLEQYLHGDGTAIIEWAERLPAGECVECLRVSLRYLSACGARAAGLLRRFERAYAEGAGEGEVC